MFVQLDLADELDLWAVLIPAQVKDPRGEMGFDRRMLAMPTPKRLSMLLLYACCVGIVSSRRIERACLEERPFRMLTGNQQPDHSGISEFRRWNATLSMVCSWRSCGCA